MSHQESVGRKIYVGVLSGVGLTAISVMVGFIQFRLIVEFLPKELAGVWFLFLSIGAYVAYFDLGISPTISREVGFISGHVDKDDGIRRIEIADLLATCIRLFRIISVVVFLVCLFAGGLFLAKVSSADSRIEITVAWFVFTLGASINISGGAWFAALYGLGHVATERMLRCITQILGLFLCALFLYLGFGIIGLSAAWAIQGIFVRVAGWIALRRTCPFLKSNPGISRKSTLKKIAVPSLKLAATGLGAILILQTDNIIIASVIGPAAIPPYEAASRLAYYCFSLSMLVIGSSTPFISKLSAAGDQAGVRNLTLKNIRYSMSFMVLMASFFAIFSDRAVQLWLGGGNFVGFPVVWVLLVMLVLEVHHNILGSATMATGRIVFYWVALCAGLLNIVLTLVLVKHFGLLGVALGTLCAQLLTNNWYVPFISFRHLRIPIFEYLRKTIVPLCAVFILMFSINKVISWLIEPLKGASGLVLALALSAPIGLFFVGTLILTRNERKEISTNIVRWRIHC